MAQLKYGWVRGGKLSFPLPMGASEVINNLSGKFVKNDGSGRGEIAGDGDTELLGWVEAEAGTLSATEGATSFNCICDTNAVFRIPVNAGIYAATMLGKTCDLSVAAGIQGAQLDASAEDTLIIVGGSVADQTVDVKLNPAKLGSTGVV